MSSEVNLPQSMLQSFIRPGFYGLGCMLKDKDEDSIFLNLTGRALFVAQVITTIVMTPFILLAGIFDILCTAVESLLASAISDKEVEVLPTIMFNGLTLGLTILAGVGSILAAILPFSATEALMKCVKDCIDGKSDDSSQRNVCQAAPAHDYSSNETSHNYSPQNYGYSSDED